MPEPSQRRCGRSRGRRAAPCACGPTRPFAEVARRASAAAASASARCSDEAGFTSQPVFPGSTHSAAPVLVVVITGRAQAIASATAKGEPSSSVGRAKTSASASASRGSPGRTMTSRPWRSRSRRMRLHRSPVAPTNRRLTGTRAPRLRTARRRYTNPFRRSRLPTQQTRSGPVGGSITGPQRYRSRSTGCCRHVNRSSRHAAGGQRLDRPMR